MDIATAMELSRLDVENIRVAGLMHDIGKIEISGEILQKASELSMDERELMDTHSVKAAYILTAVGSVLKEGVPIVVAHHRYFVGAIEESDSNKQKVPLGARVVAVADAFDPMTTDRPNRHGMPPWETLKELVEKGGKQFDPRVIEAFKQVISSRLEKV